LKNEKTITDPTLVPGQTVLAVLGLSLVTLGAVVFVALFSITTVEQEVSGNLRKHLQSSLARSVKMFKIWEKDVSSKAESIVLKLKDQKQILKIRDYLKTPGSPKKIESKELEEIRDYLKPILARHDFFGFVLLDITGEAIIASEDGAMGHSNMIKKAGRGFFDQALLGISSLALPFKSESSIPNQEGVLNDNLPNMLIASPVYDDSGTIFSILTLRIRPEDVFTHIFEIERTGETGEIYAFNSLGQLISESRFNSDLVNRGLLKDFDTPSILNMDLRDIGKNAKQSMLPREQLPMTRMAQSALKGETGYDFKGYRNYRGISVVGAWSWLPEFGFGLASEMQTSEAFLPIYYLRKWFLLLFGVLFLVSLLAIILRIKHRRIEEALVIAKAEAMEASRAKTTFLSNMSHEIRTPMNAILGYSQILLRGKNLDSEQKKALQTIDSSGNNLLEMINEILDISKIEAGKMEVNPVNFNLIELTDEISSMFELRCQQKRLTWKVKGIDQPCIVKGDELKIRAILINLIGNAVKFTEAGEVTFKIESLLNNRYMFEVIDTGRGISTNNQKNIFMPFNQEKSGAKMGGTGLGLAIAAKQLTLMKSELKMESKIGKGSRFYFSLALPKAEGSIEKRNALAPKILSLAEGYHVKALVVDDIKENRDVLSSFLKELKVDVKQAVDGKDCLEKVRDFIPDIIFMDIRMPVMDGREAIEAILKEYGNNRFKIAVVTASALDIDRETFTNIGAHDFITKPFRVEEITKSLETLLSVEFEYEKESVPEQDLTKISELDYAQISLPKELHSELIEAAKSYNVTKLESIVNKLDTEKDDCKQLAIKIKRLVRKFDMDEILEITSRLNNE
jgi:signal transduction histidine kinase/DNA-binding response OmpR family regulator